MNTRTSLRNRLRPLAAIVCALCLALPASASAAPPAKPSNPEAERLLDEGVAEYQAGNYEAAIDKLKQGHEVEPALSFLYTWAQAERQRGNCKAAVKLYQRIVDSEHETFAKYANAGIVECAKVMADEEEGQADPIDEPVDLEGEDYEEPVDEPAGVEPVEERSSDRGGKAWYRDALGGSLVAVGVVGLGVGAGLLAKAEIDAKRNEDQAPDPGDDMLDYGEFSERADRVRTFRIAGGVVAGVGGALLIGGVIRWALVGTQAKRSSSVAVTMGRDFTGLTWRGRF